MQCRRAIQDIQKRLTPPAEDMHYRSITSDSHSKILSRMILDEVFKSCAQVEGGMPIMWGSQRDMKISCHAPA